MSHLEKLTLSEATKKAETSQPNLVLRKKMLSHLDEQIKGAEAELAGQLFVRQRKRWMPTENGGKELRTVESAFRKCWFTNAKGQVLIELKFGNKPVPIKGKPSVLVGEIATLPAVLRTLREAVVAGELDAELAAASDQRKRTRKRKSGLPTGGGTGGASGVKAMFARNGK